MRTAIVAGYAIVLAAAVGLDVAGRRWNRWVSADAAVRAVLATRPGRWLLLSGWLWLGWHLFVRSDRP